ncbi:carboxypeptidase-like regulatory domain-containing protein [uncultured Sunxiuqinia sp.]|uniref:carboxypeptidase-like regulatory domain-containing protein n=1 Tax=uncultured Sunxiuqinia sp. TaxID=1573825 RepID=UPI003749DD6F
MNYLSIFFIYFSNAQKLKTDASIIGQVVSNDEHLPFASISVKGTTMETVTDETGHYQLVNLPEGTYNY